MSILSRLAKLFRRPAAAPRAKSFEGARTDEITFGFQPAYASLDAELVQSLDRLRGRSRQLAQNNDYARKYLRAVKTNVVGHCGFDLQVLAQEGATMDSLANTLIENEFDQWSALGSCEITGRMSLATLEKVVATTVARDGEALVRRIRGTGAGNRWNFALQLLDIDRLPTNLNHRYGENQVVMGVEINRAGRAVAYWLHRAHPGNTLSATLDLQRFERVSAEDIFHLFQPERPEQRRGIPAMHTAMLRMEMLQKFEYAATVAARKGAETMGFIVSPNGDPLAGDAKTADGDPVSLSTPGTYETLPAGYDFRAHDSKYPTDVFAPFVKGVLRGISSGLGISYNSLASDLESVNYSSLRAGALEERDEWMDWQSWFIDAFLTPLFRDWLLVSLTSGALKYQSGNALSVAKYEKFAVHKWQGRRWPWVDPLKDVQASIAAIDAKLTSRRAVIAESGRDLEEVWTQLAAEDILAASLDLDLSPSGKEQPPAPASSSSSASASVEEPTSSD